MAFEELCHSHAVGAVALHPDMQAFQTEVQQERILRRLELPRSRISCAVALVM